MAKTDKKTASSIDSKKKKTAEDSLSSKSSKAVAASPSKVKKSPSSSKSKQQQQPATQTVSSSLELILPPTLGNATGECNVLIQVDPTDSAALDFEGTTGAIGRFQCDKSGIVLDLKGSQYQGSILPGPTAMIASLYYTADQTQELRLEAITDEFCPIHKTQDLMAKLDGQVEGTLDESYQLQEEDVNITAKRQEQQQQQQQKQQKEQAKKSKEAKGGGSKRAKSTTNSSSKSSSGGGGKRKASTASTKTAKVSSNKRMKVTMGRKK